MERDRDAQLRRRMAAIAQAPGGTDEEDQMNAPTGDLNSAERGRQREFLLDQNEELRNQIENMTLATWARIRAGCYHNYADSKLEDLINTFNRLSEGPRPSEAEQNLIDTFVGAAVAAGQQHPTQPGMIRMQGPRGEGHVDMDSQLLARHMADTGADFGKTPQEKVIRNIQRVLTKAFFGSLARGATTLRAAMNAVIHSISGISDNLVSFLPPSQQANGKLVLSSALYIIFSYYVVPMLLNKTGTMVADCTKTACSKVAESCSIMGGKKKSRRHRSHKKRKSRKTSKSRKGRKSPKRKVKRGKTHKRKARKGRKSHKRKH